MRWRARPKPIRRWSAEGSVSQVILFSSRDFRINFRNREWMPMSSKNACSIVYCKSVSLLAVLVALIGMLLIMKGIRGLAASAIIILAVHFFQTLPVIYLTAVLLVVGLIVVI